MAIRITQINRTGVKMLKRANRATVKRAHLERATAIRNQAANMIEEGLFGMPFTDEQKADIKRESEFQAIAVENCKCMDGNH